MGGWRGAVRVLTAAVRGRHAVCTTSRQLVGVPSRTPSRRSTAASRTGTTSAGWRARRGGWVGERAGVVSVEVEVGEAVAVRQTNA